MGRGEARKGRRTQSRSTTERTRSQSTRSERVLPRPTGGTPPTTPARYRIVPASKSIEKEWRDLSVSHAGNLRRYYDYLERTPKTPEGERVYPMKGDELAGLWGCEVGGGARFYYRVDEEEHIVLVREIRTSHR